MLLWDVLNQLILTCGFHGVGLDDKWFLFVDIEPNISIIFILISLLGFLGHDVFFINFNYFIFHNWRFILNLR